MRAMGASLLRRMTRIVLLVLLVAVGTVALTRYAPGYFSDNREMDAQYSQGVRVELDSREKTERSASTMTLAMATGWLHGDLGQSRQFGIPVTELMKPRLMVTGSLLLRAIVSGSLFAFALALPLSARLGNSGEALLAVSSALLLALPIGAMATLCLLTESGGPALVLTVLIGTRSFKFLYPLLRGAWKAPYLLHARAQGISSVRIARVYLLPAIKPQLLALGTMSFVLALSAVVPAEVIFNVPGIGQLAWTAAMNRDLPVLLAVTLLMASAVGLAGLFGGSPMKRAIEAELA